MWLLTCLHSFFHAELTWTALWNSVVWAGVVRHRDKIGDWTKRRVHFSSSLVEILMTRCLSDLERHRRGLLGQVCAGSFQVNHAFCWDDLLRCHVRRFLCNLRWGLVGTLFLVSRVLWEINSCELHNWFFLLLLHIRLLDKRWLRLGRSHRYCLLPINSLYLVKDCVSSRCWHCRFYSKLATAIKSLRTILISDGLEKTSWLVSVGTRLCILGPSVFFLLNAWLFKILRDGRELVLKLKLRR